MQEGHPIGADLILQLPRVAAVLFQDAQTQDHQQLLRVYKRQQNPIKLEDEASGPGGEHQQAVQGEVQVGLVPTGCFGDMRGPSKQPTEIQSRVD